MKNSNTALRRLAEGGIIAAMYTVLTLVLSPIAFGPVQFRVSEMLTILPVFTPAAIPGLAVGCVLSNMFGMFMGTNLIGAWDLVLGPMATLIAALMTYWFRNVRVNGLPVLATLPPIILNAVIVGWELTFVLFGFSWPIYLINVAQVAAGQFGACTIIGLLVFTALQRSGAAKTIFYKRLL